MSNSSGEGGGAKPKRIESLERHSRRHKMHLAIERATNINFEEVQKLLDRGHGLCTDDGLNCFILAARKEPVDRLPMVMKMLEVNYNGVYAVDEDGVTLFKYLYNGLVNLKQLGLSADLNKMDIQVLLGTELIEASENKIRNYGKRFCSNFMELWDLLLEFKDVQIHVTEADFFGELVQRSRDPNSLAYKMVCSFIKKGIMSVKELTKKLKMHPLNFIILYNLEESLRFLLYIWGNDPDKEKNICDLGGDLNIVDSSGKTLMECLFGPDSMKQYFSESGSLLALDLWKLLIAHSETQGQASKVGFLRSIAPLANKNPIVRGIFEDIFLQDMWSVDKITQDLQMHPLVFLPVVAEGEPIKLIRLLKTCPRFLKDKTITISKEFVDVGRSCKIIKYLCNNIPDLLTFDIFGYILFTLKLDYKSDEESTVSQCLYTLVDNGFVPSQVEGVVHPIHALLYNIIINSNKGFYGASQKNLPGLLLETITFFQDSVPIPHQLVLAGADWAEVLSLSLEKVEIVWQELVGSVRRCELDPKTGVWMLDAHLLMSSMLIPELMLMRSQSRSSTLFELIMALMQLSPLHPLQHFTTFYQYSLHYYSRYCEYGLCSNIRHQFLEPFCKLLRLCLEASGKYKFQGVDQQTFNCINDLFETFKWLPHTFREGEEVSLFKKTAIKAESEVSSLQWMCILQIRKTLFLRRSSTTVTLPSLIRGLVAEGRLPQGLEAEVLVYKPNEHINF